MQVKGYECECLFSRGKPCDGNANTDPVNVVHAIADVQRRQEYAMHQMMGLSYRMLDRWDPYQRPRVPDDEI